MIAFRNILCPVDFSEFSRHALDLMLFGSTTQHVVREATFPVLTIRAG